MTAFILPDLPPDSLVAVDTETSGLFVDDGARVSIVSIAYWPDGKTPVTRGEGYDRGALPETGLFAFDQGQVTPLGSKLTTRKTGQPSLFDDNIDAAPNLDPRHYLELIEWLEDKCLVFHNSKFDLHILAQGLRGYEDRKALLPDLSYSVTWDTMVANRVLWPQFPTSLKPTSERIFGIGEADLQRQLQVWLKKHDYRFDLAPWPLVGPYAAQDASLTLRLFDAQMIDIDSGSAGDPSTVREVCDREVDMAIALYRMESRGVGFDRDACLREAEKLARMVAKADKDLTEQVEKLFAAKGSDARVPPITEAFMRHTWFGSTGKTTHHTPSLGLKPIAVTDKGLPQVTIEVVRTLKEREVPLAAEYETLNKLETALSMWYRAWPEACGDPQPGWHAHVDHRLPRLRTSYRQGRTHGDGKGGTVSGRFAVERVQLQAIPQDYQIPEGLKPIRRFFKPDPGYRLVEMDLSQAEFRVAAGVSNCKLMIEQIEAGGWDAHDSTTMLMFGIDKDHPDWKFLRQVAKRLNFGMIYGAGVPTIARQIEMYTGRKVSIPQIEEWRSRFKDTFPELGRKSRWAQRQVERTREIQLAGGGVRWFNPYESEHKAFNQLIQGGVAEMMKVAMIDIEAYHPGVMLLQIHDSVIVEVPDNEAGQNVVDACQEILCSTFTNEFGVTFVSDSKDWE